MRRKELHFPYPYGCRKCSSLLHDDKNPAERDLDSAHTCVSGCFCHCLGNCLCHTFVKRIRDNVICVQLFFVDKTGDGIRCCHLHFIVDVLCSHIQRTAEDTRECQNIVDLVGEIASSCSHNGCSCCLCQVRHDLRYRVCHWEEEP